MNNGIKPGIPKLQSIKISNSGMSRTGPAINTSAKIVTQASVAHSIVHTFLIGYFRGAIKTFAVTMCAKASQV